MNSDIPNTENPFFKPYNTLHDTIPFNSITDDDYEPAIRKGIELENQEINDIIHSKEKPSLENTIVALTDSGKVLDRATTVLFNLLSAESSDKLEELAQKLSPILSDHANDIVLNEQLFLRIKAVWEERDKYTGEELRLIEKTFEGFERSGANLNDTEKEEFRKLTSQLSQLTLQFSNNLLKETNAFTLQVTYKADLAGLPEGQIEQAAQTAQEKKMDGWVFTLHAPSYVPFMKYAQNRELRKKLYLAYNTRCTHSNEQNNYEVVRSIVNYRLKIARLLGFKSFADYALTRRMAAKTENVEKLLNDLIKAYKAPAIHEVEVIEAKAKEIEGNDFVLQPWDFGYYSNLLKQAEYGLDDEMLRPYFEISKVIKGVFGLAEHLYGIHFRENRDIQVYHPDVMPYEVFDKDGSYLAVLYADFYPREGKKGGAWMTNYKEQWHNADGTDSRPHVSITTNFTKPSGNKPALLTFDEVETFLHEFGHTLHGMFAATRFRALSGTSVYWDFVELPSQFMENYAVEKEFLNTFAFHYETGEPIPDELIEKIVRSRNFHAAYACMRQVSFGLLDMSYYTRTEPLTEDIAKFEQQAWKQAQLLPTVDETCMTVQFSHIMAGGYAAGYYSYKWAEVLDADAFSLFREKGIFNQEVANSFRNKILSRGGTEDPMKLYTEFRGRRPNIDALLQRTGITQQNS